VILAKICHRSRIALAQAEKTGKIVQSRVPEERSHLR